MVTGHSSSLFGWRLTGSLVAVQTFFIISGFYMSLILDRKYRGPGSYRLFLSNRLLRLFPPYWVAMGVAAIAAIVCYVFFEAPNVIARIWENPEHLAPSSLAFLLFSNLGIIGQDQVMFMGAAADGTLAPLADFRHSSPQLWTYLFLPPAWSIAVEISFYALAPFLVRRRLPAIFALIAASAVLRIWLHKGCGLNFDPWTYRFFPNELGLFLLGTVAYRIYQRVKTIELPKAGLAAIALNFALVTLAFQWLPGGISKKACFYALATVSIPFIFQLTKSWHWDRRVGELSYPVYISHFIFLPSFDGMHWIWPESARMLQLQQSPYYGVIVMAATLLFSLALLRYVIDPLEVYRQARVTKKKIT